MILAPVARDRKGEFLDVFAAMQAQGYVRFRVDGQLFEYEDLPKLKKTEKHNIDVVIDRLKVRPDMQQRLAESFEAALRLAESRAIALEMGLAAGTPVQRQVCLPGVQLLAQRAGAAAVLVQLTRGRLPDLRRPGPAGLF
jgi:excinuclease UvrABC ATPase subunit